MYFKATPINWNNYHYLILSAPTESTFDKYLADLKENNVTHLVRVLNEKSSIPEEKFTDAGIKVTELNMETSNDIEEKNVIE